MPDKLIIAVSKLAPNYEKWLRWLDPDIEPIDLYAQAPGEIEKSLRNSSGVLLTGGCDIHPLLYKREQDIRFCRNIDERRDALELGTIKLCMQMKIPLFGICRGQQMLNVARGGTLFADIPFYCKTDVTHAADEDVWHTVNILEGSLLHRLSGLTSGLVNSAHHQVIDLLGEGFKGVAFCSDSIVEAIEWNKRADDPFCMAVQWHPERMEFDHPLSGNIGKGFIQAARKRLI